MGELGSALLQLKQMIEGAQSEIDLGRAHSCGTLAIAGSVRASDLICDASLGYHSIAASHQAAGDLLSQIGGNENFVEDFSFCNARKTEFNYHTSDLTIEDAREVLECAKHLAMEALRLITIKGWFPSTERVESFRFISSHT